MLRFGGRVQERGGAPDAGRGDAPGSGCGRAGERRSRLRARAGGRAPPPTPARGHPGRARGRDPTRRLRATERWEEGEARPGGRRAPACWRATRKARASPRLGERGDLRSEVAGDAFLRFLCAGIQNASYEWVICWSQKSDMQSTVRDLFLGLGNFVGVSLKQKQKAKTGPFYKCFRK